MFQKILVANRGEIACRIFRTARRMGIRTVAVYSAVDKRSVHVAMADEAVAIGPAASAESYLNIERILEACRQTGAEAVHPGYGFLSENAEFARRLVAAGVTFIGPRPEAMAALGDKIAARQLARKANVNIVPGCDEPLENADQAIAAARRCGYPAILKASAGGGGKGMRTVRDDDECRREFARAASEARAAFGDGRLFVEKLIERPRHIEVQILGDRHGSVIHLGERECSLQRRHQKVIEEAPSPHLDDAARAALGAQAAALARAAGYDSAGTVEFLVDERRSAYFLEMNTRLQVEHPVTEMITGLDLVELMIRVAAGEPLPLSQDQVRRRGWAVEARIYAEDPQRHFLPSPGRLVHYSPPAAGEGLRVDDGAQEGGEVTAHYDPLIGKLIAHGASRQQAIDRLLEGLDEWRISGVANNLAFLAALVDCRPFREGRLHTGFIAEHFPGGELPRSAWGEKVDCLLAAAAVMQFLSAERDALIEGQLQPPKTPPPAAWTALLAGERFPLEVQRAGPEAIEVVVNGRRRLVVTAWRPGEGMFRASIDDTQVRMQVERQDLAWRLRRRGIEAMVTVLPARAAELLAVLPPKKTATTTERLASPMPGLLSHLLVAAGDSVRAGQPLAVVEAMKMENLLLAERDATVARTVAQAGQTLAAGEVILEFQ